MPPLDAMTSPVGAGSPGGAAGPSPAPMSNPSEQEGLKAQAMQGVQLAIKLLEAAMLPFGSQSPEGKKLLSAVNSLSKIAGASGNPEMNEAEIKMLNAKVSPEPIPPGGGPGGGAPGGAPGGGGMPGGMMMGGPMPRGL